MPVEVLWEDGDGSILGRFPEPGFDIRVLALADPASSCLRFVDPYGETVFNQLQLPVLIGELEAARVAAPEAELRGHLDALLSFLDERVDRADTVIRFSGS